MAHNKYLSLRIAMKTLRTAIFILIFGIAAGFCCGQDISILPTPEGSRNQTPVIGFTPDGTLWSAWASFQEGRFRLAVCSHRANQWGEIVYPDAGSADQSDPQWIIGGSPLPRLVYSAYADGRGTVRETKKKPGGWSDPVQIGEGTFPTACRAGDIVWVAWEDKGRILYKQQTENSWISEPELISSDHPSGSLSSPVLCPGPAGEVWLAWTCAQTGYQGIRLQRIDRPGHPELIVDEGSGVNRHPQLSMDANGRIWIVFEYLSAVERGQRAALAEKQLPVYVI